MAYQFTQTGAEIQDILNQVPDNTSNIAQNAADISALQSTKASLIVHTGTATTSAAGTASFATSYSVANYACLSVMAVGAVQGYLLLPYKYGDAADGRWGFKAAVSGTLAAIANTSISYVAIFYKYA